VIYPLRLLILLRIRQVDIDIIPEININNNPGIKLVTLAIFGPK